MRAQEIQAAPTVKLWTHDRCLPVRCDVRLKAQVEAAVKKCMDHFGKLDVVVKFIPLHFGMLIKLVALGGGFLVRVRNKRISNYEHNLKQMYMERSI